MIRSISYLKVNKALSIPNDTYFPQLWGMHNTGQTGGVPDADIDAPEAWEITIDSDIIVAVIDTGVNYNHPDLKANMWINPGEDHPPLGVVGPEDFDGVDDDHNDYIDDIYGYDFCTKYGKLRDSDPNDDNFHGTHCAGIIGAVGNNGVGVTGVCWNVKIMAVKFLAYDGSGNTWDAVASIKYAVKMGTKVLSNSWGGGGPDEELIDAIEAAGANGVLFVAAAGNPWDWEDPDNDSSPRYPASYDCNNIIAVMATDHSDLRSIWYGSSSAYGAKSVDLAAPGSDILSCVPYNIYGQYYDSKSGTSMATPHVAGACALVWSMNRTLSYL